MPVAVFKSGVGLHLYATQQIHAINVGLEQPFDKAQDGHQINAAIQTQTN
jgi:hypothetical protein